MKLKVHLTLLDIIVYKKRKNEIDLDHGHFHFQ